MAAIRSSLAMISYTDPDYIRTAAIKRGEATRTQTFIDLGNWIAAKFDCECPLNIEYERCELASQYRLQVIFEHEFVDEKFWDEAGNFDEVKQQQVADQFCKMLSAPPGVTKKDFFVIFTTFEPVARWQANAAISDRLSAIEHRLAPLGVWKVHQQFGYASILFHTDAQVEELTDEARETCQRLYMAELLPHDEFGYFRARPIELQFDSRERFKRDFEGNWFLYDR